MKSGLLVAVILSVIAGSLGQMIGGMPGRPGGMPGRPGGQPGGLFPMNPNNQFSEDLQKATEFAIGELGGKFQLQNLINVQQQVVSGMMYYINAMVVKDGYKPHVCYFHVQSQPWMPTPHTLSQFGCRQMPANQMPFNTMSTNQIPNNQQTSTNQQAAGNLQG